MNTGISAAFLNGAVTLLCAAVAVVPAVWKLLADAKKTRRESADENRREHRRLAQKMDDHIEADERSREETRQALNAIRTNILRRDVFDKSIPLADRVTSGEAYLALHEGHNGAGQVQHEVNVGNLRRKLEKKEAADANG